MTETLQKQHYPDPSAADSSLSIDRLMTQMDQLEAQHLPGSQEAAEECPSGVASLAEYRAEKASDALLEEMSTNLAEILFRYQDQPENLAANLAITTEDPAVFYQNLIRLQDLIGNALNSANPQAVSQVIELGKWLRGYLKSEIDSDEVIDGVVIINTLRESGVVDPELVDFLINYLSKIPKISSENEGEQAFLYGSLAVVIQKLLSGKPVSPEELATVDDIDLAAIGLESPLRELRAGLLASPYQAVQTDQLSIYGPTTCIGLQTPEGNSNLDAEIMCTNRCILNFNETPEISKSELEILIGPLPPDIAQHNFHLLSEVWSYLKSETITYLENKFSNLKFQAGILPEELVRGNLNIVDMGTGPVNVANQLLLRHQYVFNYLAEIQDLDIQTLNIDPEAKIKATERVSKLMMSLGVDTFADLQEVIISSSIGYLEITDLHPFTRRVIDPQGRYFELVDSYLNSGIEPDAARYNAAKQILGPILSEFSVMEREISANTILSDEVAADTPSATENYLENSLVGEMKKLRREAGALAKLIFDHQDAISSPEKSTGLALEVVIDLFNKKMITSIIPALDRLLQDFDFDSPSRQHYLAIRQYVSYVLEGLISQLCLLISRNQSDLPHQAVQEAWEAIDMLNEIGIAIFDNESSLAVSGLSFSKGWPDDFPKEVAMQKAV